MNKLRQNIHQTFLLSVEIGETHHEILRGKPEAQPYVFRYLNILFRFMMCADRGKINVNEAPDYMFHFDSPKHIVRHNIYLILGISS